MFLITSSATFPEYPTSHLIEASIFVQLAFQVSINRVQEGGSVTALQALNAPSPNISGNLDLNR